MKNFGDSDNQKTHRDRLDRLLGVVVAARLAPMSPVDKIKWAIGLALQVASSLTDEQLEVWIDDIIQEE